MDNIDAVFGHLLGEMSNLSQSLAPDAEAPLRDRTLCIGFDDLDESLNGMDEHELDDLVANLGSRPTSSAMGRTAVDPPIRSGGDDQISLPRPKSSGGPQSEPLTKTEKIKLALEKLKEAKCRKLIVKVLMSDGGSKTLMVDERQTVRDVVDKLIEKTHCDGGIGWSLSETNPELHTERSFEDHEFLVEPLSAWPRHSQNKIYFTSRPQRYRIFMEPQLFYMLNKGMASLSDVSEKAKDLLIQESFGGSTVIVPNLEGTLYLKEDGRKVWKPQYFTLRASGIYYVPKGKTKASTDLVCFVRFEQIDIYTTSSYTQKYKAPSNFCFILKHPHIQKESPYIKFLCCRSADMLQLWVNSIRVAKYGTALHRNYQVAVQKAAALQTPHHAARTDKCDIPAGQIDPKPTAASPPETWDVTDFPLEEPPDFIPPSPPPRPGDAQAGERLPPVDEGSF